MTIGKVYPVGIIGVGNMGGAMARNLMSHQWPVHVCDIDSDKTLALAALGAKIHHNPATTAASTELIIVCVVDAIQSEEVLFGDYGAAKHLKAGQCVMLCPTISPDETENFAKRLTALGIHTLDAPMSGGPARARDGSMSLMVACDDAVYEQCHALILALSSKVFKISEKPGDAARTKLVNNLLAAINLAGAAEVMALSERMGLNVQTTLNVIEQSSGQSWIGSDRMQRAIVDDFEPRAHTTLLAKDTKLAIGVANQLDFKAILGKAAADTFSRALICGLADEDDASLLKLARLENKGPR